MNQWLPGLDALRRNRRRGVSLIIAMCASALLLSLSLRLIYSASMPMARANQKIPTERCYRLANSFGEVLDGELRSYVRAVDAPGNSFYVYVNGVLEGEYASHQPLSCQSEQTEYGEITVNLRLTEDSGRLDTVAGGLFPGGNSHGAVQAAEQEAFVRHVFFVDVSAALDGCEYTRSEEYYRLDSFRPVFTYEGAPVYWGGEGWYADAAFQTPMTIPDEGMIVYSYDENVITQMRFSPTHGEGG